MKDITYTLTFTVHGRESDTDEQVAQAADAMFYILDVATTRALQHGLDAYRTNATARSSTSTTRQAVSTS